MQTRLLLNAATWFVLAEERRSTDYRQATRCHSKGKPTNKAADVDSSTISQTDSPGFFWHTVLHRIFGYLLLKVLYLPSHRHNDKKRHKLPRNTHMYICVWCYYSHLSVLQGDLFRKELEMPGHPTSVITDDGEMTFFSVLYANDATTPERSHLAYAMLKKGDPKITVRRRVRHSKGKPTSKAADADSSAKSQKGRPGFRLAHFPTQEPWRLAYILLKVRQWDVQGKLTFRWEMDPDCSGAPALCMVCNEFISKITTDPWREL